MAKRQATKLGLAAAAAARDPQVRRDVASCALAFAKAGLSAKAGTIDTGGMSTGGRIDGLCSALGLFFKGAALAKGAESTGK